MICKCANVYVNTGYLSPIPAWNRQAVGGDVGRDHCFNVGEISEAHESCLVVANGTGPQVHDLKWWTREGLALKGGLELDTMSAVEEAREPIVTHATHEHIYHNAMFNGFGVFCVFCVIFTRRRGSTKKRRTCPTDNVVLKALLRDTAAGAAGPAGAIAGVFSVSTGAGTGTEDGSRATSVRDVGSPLRRNVHRKGSLDQCPMSTPIAVTPTWEMACFPLDISGGDGVPGRFGHLHYSVPIQGIDPLHTTHGTVSGRSVKQRHCNALTCHKRHR